MLITLKEYRQQIFDLRDGNIEVTAFIDDSRFNRNNLWESSWAWQNTAGQLHNIGESDDVVRLMTVHKSKGLEFRVVFGALLLVRLAGWIRCRRRGEKLGVMSPEEICAACRRMRQ